MSDDEIRKLQAQRKSSDLGISMSGQGQFDSSIYGGTDKSNYLQALPEEDDEGEDNDNGVGNRMSNSGAPGRHFVGGDSEDAPDYREQFGSGIVNTRISDRESEVICKYIFI